MKNSTAPSGGSPRSIDVEELVRAKEALELRTQELERSLALLHAQLAATTQSSLVADAVRRRSDETRQRLDITARRSSEEALREEARITETLHRPGLTHAAELDLQKIVQTVTDESTLITGAQFGAFFYNLINERGESYTPYTLSGVPRDAFASFPMPRNTQIFEPTFLGRGGRRHNGVSQDTR